MNLELSVTSANAKQRAISVLTDHGFRAATGSVRLAYPFAIMVENIAVTDVDAICALAASVDPGSGTIMEPTRVA